MSNESKKSNAKSDPHEVVFIAYPKLLFIWPIILLGFLFFPIAQAGHDAAAPPPVDATTQPVTASAQQEAVADETPATRPAGTTTRNEVLGWIYLWTAVIVLLTLGVDIDRNKAIVWIVFVVSIVVLGLWLRDIHHFTLFGDVYRWFANLDLAYDRSFGLALSLILLVPYVVMLLWARLNDRWRITHNEFEHYSFGKMNDSVGRGAKTIRTDFPDVFELLLGLAGTLIVYNATGTKELRRIHHVMFLPFVRSRLNRILEHTAVTAAMYEEDDDEDA